MNISLILTEFFYINGIYISYRFYQCKKKYSQDNGNNIVIDDGTLSISISLPLDMYERRYFKITEEKNSAHEI